MIKTVSGNQYLFRRKKVRNWRSGVYNRLEEKCAGSRIIEKYKKRIHLANGSSIAIGLTVRPEASNCNCGMLNR